MPKTDPKTDPMNEVKDVIDEVTDPKRMSKTDYVEFLSELIGDLEIRKEAAEQELADEVAE